MKKQSFKKDICPRCGKVRIMVPVIVAFVKPGMKCTKCGHCVISRK